MQLNRDNTVSEEIVDKGRFDFKKSMIDKNVYLKICFGFCLLQVKVVLRERKVNLDLLDPQAEKERKVLREIWDLLE